MKNTIVLIIISILLTACLISILCCRGKREGYHQTIAVYGANFGGYRNEISRQKLSDCKLDKSVDYFFYTDQLGLNCDGWKMRFPSKVAGDDIMDSNRWMSKRTKWLVPEELHSYDIIVWIDSKLFPMKYSRETITDMFAEYPDKELFILEHPYGRKTSIGEMHETVSIGVENRSEKVEEFYNILSDFDDPVPLADTCQLIMRNSPEVIHLLETVFNTLKEYGLKRDQCVFNYALAHSGYPVSKVCITRNMPITRPVLNHMNGVFRKTRESERKVIEDIASAKSQKLISDTE